MLVTLTPRIVARLIKSKKANQYQDFQGTTFTAILTEQKGSDVFMDLPTCSTAGKMNRADFRLILPTTPDPVDVAAKRAVELHTAHHDDANRAAFDDAMDELEDMLKATARWQ